MRFNRLTLENVGQYRGKHEFNLLSKSSETQFRPIILFGGKNGAGKTTILKSILLCLYGQLSLGNRTGRSEYEKYLSAMIHDSRGKALAPHQANIWLEFEYTHAGEQNSYHVHRSWNNGKSQLKEFLTVRKNEDSLDDFTQEQWQDFINGIIPQPLSTLFFFDGEKIKHLAETSGNDGLALAIRSLLGLDLVNQLQTDLNYLNAEEIKKSMSGQALSEMESIAKDLEKIEDQLEFYDQEIRHCETNLEHKSKMILEKEQKLGNQGGSFAKMREKNQSKYESLKTEIRFKETSLRELAEESFPFCLVPELMESLQQQILQEQKNRDHQTLIKFYDHQLGEEIQQALVSPLEDHGVIFSSTQLKGVSESFRKELRDKLFVDEENTNVSSLHRFSEEQEQRFFEILKDTQTRLPFKVQSLCKEIEKAQIEASRTQQLISKAPDGFVLQELLSEIKQLQSEFYQSEQELHKLREECNLIKKQYKEKRRDHQLLLDQVENYEVHKRKIHLMNSTQQVLEKYQERLKAKKMEQLELELARCWKQLTRKEGFVDRVKIHPDTFEVNLYNCEGHMISKEKLSSGEKQMYAVSILWSLARISGKPLPVIIDTPLGRLDSDHRSHLVERYFPYASHQVIILSTDTELDQEYYETLKPSISHTFHLEFDDTLQETKVESGYFGVV